jgi:hypothetical protein
MRLPILIVCVPLFAPSSAVEAQALTPSGSEFQVNSFTANMQNLAAISSDADGDFVVVWSRQSDGSDYGIFGQRWSSSGTRLAAEFQVNASTETTQTRARIAAEADGSFVVAWFSFLQDGDTGGIFARRFAADGTPQGIDFQANSYTPSYQNLPAVAADADGDFVIAWSSEGQDGDQNGIFARRFNSVGVAQAVEFQVNSHTAGNQDFAAVSSAAAGSFVISWSSYGQDGDNYGVFARRFDSGGSPQATEFQVNAFTALSQFRSAIAHDDAGQFVIVWTSFEQDGSQPGVFARRFGSTGQATGTEFQVNSFTGNDQQRPSVAFDSAGDFAVVWQGYGVSGVDEIFARAFDSAGAPKGADFQVNSTGAGLQIYPAVASTGSFVVVWTSAGQDGPSGQDGSYGGIFARRLQASVLPVLDLDGNGSLGALTDGLLFLRHLFGFSGSTLSGGAVGGGCTRCDGASIAAYIVGRGLTLDIDGDLALQPLTDGLLVLRYLFGFSGTALTTGATSSSCSRCDAAAIVPYLQTLD